MHLARINTCTALDLSSPLIALALSRVLLSLEAPISAIRDSVKSILGVVIDELQSQSAVSWRTDRCVQGEESNLGDRDEHDKITRWIEDQQCISSGAQHRATPRAGSRESCVSTCKYLSAMADLRIVGLVMEAHWWDQSRGSQRLGKSTRKAELHSLTQSYSVHCAHQLEKAMQTYQESKEKGRVII